MPKEDQDAATDEHAFIACIRCASGDFTLTWCGLVDIRMCLAGWQQLCGKVELCMLMCPGEYGELLLPGAPGYILAGEESVSASPDQVRVSIQFLPWRRVAVAAAATAHS